MQNSAAPGEQENALEDQHARTTTFHYANFTSVALATWVPNAAFSTDQQANDLRQHLPQRARKEKPNPMPNPTPSPKLKARLTELLRQRHQHLTIRRRWNSLATTCIHHTVGLPPRFHAARHGSETSTLYHYSRYHYWQHTTQQPTQ